MSLDAHKLMQACHGNSKIKAWPKDEDTDIDDVSIQISGSLQSYS